MKIKTFFLIILTFLAITLVIAVSGIALIMYLNSAQPGIAVDGELFQVKRGDTIKQISERLEQNGLIKSALFLQLVCKLLNTDTEFKAGIYRILPDSSAIDIHNLLITGYQDHVHVTIPEGWTISKIANLLEEKEVTTAADFIKAIKSENILASFSIPANSVEGYLFPDTYYFPREYDTDLVVSEMIDAFFLNLKEYFVFNNNFNREEIHKKVILASIIEKEYRIKDEAPIIASVFYNRIKINKKLESCATIEYIITEILNKPHPGYLTFEDLEINSPYNTYIRQGLPPGPICNPGLVAMKAAFFPAKTEYFFFRLIDAKTGEHYFTKDFDEHLNARNLYLKGY